MPTTANALGARLRAARLRGGMTQAQLARAVGTSERNIFRWEHGKNSPRLKYLSAIAAATGETVDHFLSADGDGDGTGGGDDDGEADPVGTLADALAAAIQTFMDSNEPAAHLPASTAGSSTHGG
jgi:transcriptional regulator with XRE-family HTH domain